jgi:hypothetical protein
MPCAMAWFRLKAPACRARNATNCSACTSACSCVAFPPCRAVCFDWFGGCSSPRFGSPDLFRCSGGGADSAGAPPGDSDLPSMVLLSHQRRSAFSRHSAPLCPCLWIGEPMFREHSQADPRGHTWASRWGGRALGGFPADRMGDPPGFPSDSRRVAWWDLGGFPAGSGGRSSGGRRCASRGGRRAGRIRWSR